MPDPRIESSVPTEVILEARKSDIAKISSAFTSEYPQVGQNGGLIYFPGGSFAMNAIALADEIELIRLNDSGQPVSQGILPQDQTKAITQTLLPHARPMKDIDCVLVNPDEEHRPRNRKRFNIPEGLSNASAIFEKGTETISMDAATTMFPSDIVKVKVGQSELYCGSPLYLLANKFNQAASQFDYPNYTKKFINDLDGLIKVCSLIYGEQTPKRVLEVLHAGEDSETKGRLSLPFGNPDMPQFLVNFYEAVARSDNNYPYLTDLVELPERKLEILQVLHHHPDDRVKRGIVDFLKRNAGVLTSLKTLSAHQGNVTEVAEKICSDPVLLADFQKRSGDKELKDLSLSDPIAVEKVTNAMQKTGWAVQEYSKGIEGQLSFIPKVSETLQFLALDLSDATFEDDLRILEKGVSLTGDLFGRALSGIVQNPYPESNPKARQKILKLVEDALSKGSEEQVNQITTNLHYILEGDPLGEPDDPSWAGLGVSGLVDKMSERSEKRRNDPVWLEDRIKKLAEANGLEY